MTRMEARQIIEKYADRPVLREEDDALLRKALGQIWELGLSVGPDPEKAFLFYRKAMEHGSIRAMIRIADMSRSGEGTEKDPEKYEEMIEEAHRRIRDTSYLSDPLP